MEKSDTKRRKSSKKSEEETSWIDEERCRLFIYKDGKRSSIVVSYKDLAAMTLGFTGAPACVIEQFRQETQAAQSPNQSSKPIPAPLRGFSPPERLDESPKN